MAKRILIVDDEPHIVKMLQARLEFQEYEVLVATDGQDGLDKVRSEKPDLIILDISLPKLNGYEVCQALRADEKYKDIPVVMLTASGQALDIMQGMKDGADAYMVKPFDSETLLGILRGFLKE